MIVSISQPAYLPWLGYFDRLRRSDVAVVLDHVQLERRGFTHRNKILNQGKPMWLSIPLNKKGNFQTTINEITVNNDEKWQHKHWQTILQCYKKAPHFIELKNELASFYEKDWVLLNELLKSMTPFWMGKLGIDTPMVFSSEIELQHTKSDLILELCRKQKATKYLSGPFGRDYLETKSFQDAGIEIIYHDYEHPVYRQQSDNFEPFLSILDLMANHGDESLSLLAAGSPVKKA
ncbi:MAG: hypothetical protein CMH56_07455 [Myxococcales bacterium]|nr:hypothetical protein [Myxococcales bacterium]|tara:strand:+ start:2184 stop:2885 length:702 start_codon:yes stop_codon:yes gene_type:complete